MSSTAIERNTSAYRLSPVRLATIAFIAIAAACLAVADIEISTLDPWTELGRLARFAGLQTIQWACDREPGLGPAD